MDKCSLPKSCFEYKTSGADYSKSCFPGVLAFSLQGVLKHAKQIFLNATHPVAICCLPLHSTACVNKPHIHLPLSAFPFQHSCTTTCKRKLGGKNSPPSPHQTTFIFTTVHWLSEKVMNVKQRSLSSNPVMQVTR